MSDAEIVAALVRVLEKPRGTSRIDAARLRDILKNLLWGTHDSEFRRGETAEAPLQ